MTTPKLATPDKDPSEMGLTEFKKLLHDTMQHTLLDQYHDYLEAVKSSDDPEVKRKCVAMHITTIGAEHKEKADPNANLPVFQFNFTSTGMTATQLPVAVRVDDPADKNLPVLDFEHLAMGADARNDLAPANSMMDDLSPEELMAPWED